MIRPRTCCTASAVLLLGFVIACNTPTETRVGPDNEDTFPDYTHTIEDVVSAGDKVVVRLTLTGTQEAEFEGIPATGREMEYDQIAIFRFSEDRIAEAWAIEDNLTMMMQLGMQLVPGNADE